MSTDKKSSFVAYLKKSPFSITVQALTLLSLLIGVSVPFFKHWRLVIMLASTVGSALLIVYNVWIARATQRSVVDPSVRISVHSKRFRVWLHSISVCLLVLCWSIVVCMMSDRRAGHILFNLGRYKLASERLVSYLEEPRDDYRAHYELAKCYDELNDPNKYVETLEHLLEQKSIFGPMGPKERNEKESKIHAEIALALVSYDYITKGIDHQYEDAQKHIEDARRLDPNWPEILWMQGFITASEAGDEPSRFESAKTDVENSFADSNSVIEEMKLPEKSYEYMSYFSQHYYWFGRALSELGLYERAKNKLTAGLDIALKDRRLSDSLDGFYFHVGQNEYRWTSEIDRADYYWQNISDEDYLAGRRLLLVGLFYWSKAREARDNNDKEKFQKYFDQALGKLSEAERSGLRTQRLFSMLGILYFEKKDYVNAEAKFERDSKVNPSRYLAFYWLGRSRFCQGKDKIDQAKEAMNEAKRLKPQSADVRYWSGRILYEEGDTAGALEEFETSIEFDNKNTEVYEWCIDCLYNISKEKDRYSDDRVALLNKALGYTNSGIKVSQDQKDDSTLKAIRKWRHITLNSLAYTYAERSENFALANAYIDEALEIAKAQDPNYYPYYLDTKAWLIIKETEDANDRLTLQQKHAKYDEAEKLLRESLESLPIDFTNTRADVLFHLGYLEKLRGNKAGAQEYFLECLKHNPEHSEAGKELE
jgi:Tfp pilus assembly protein PilF